MWCLLLAAWAHGLPIETARGRSGAGQRISSNPPAATIVFESPASPHPHGRTLEDLEILVSSTAHSIHRQLQGNLLASGPAAMASLAAGTGPATDPEVARFQAYVGTLAPGVLATRPAATETSSFQPEQPHEIANGPQPGSEDPSLTAYDGADGSTCSEISLRAMLCASGVRALRIQSSRRIQFMWPTVI
eukprot:scaffold187227_cov35-Tisochrysis_lutea.AAC.1